MKRQSGAAKILADDFEAHGAGCAGDDVESGVLVLGIEVGLLRLADLENLFAGDGADSAVRHRRHA